MSKPEIQTDKPKPVVRESQGKPVAGDRWLALAVSFCGHHPFGVELERLPEAKREGKREGKR